MNSRYALISAVLICIGGLARAGDDRVLTREERIAQHHARIEEIIRVNRAVQEARGIMKDARKTSLPDVVSTGSFSGTLASALETAKVDSAVIDRLRNLNEEICRLGAKEDSIGSKAIQSEIVELLRKHDALLTDEQSKVAGDIYRQKVNRMMPSRQTSAPIGLPSQQLMELR